MRQVKVVVGLNELLFLFFSRFSRRVHLDGGRLAQSRIPDSSFSPELVTP